jgi:hypothetical protein
VGQLFIFGQATNEATNGRRVGGGSGSDHEEIVLFRLTSALYGITIGPPLPGLPTR